MHRLQASRAFKLYCFAEADAPSSMEDSLRSLPLDLDAQKGGSSGPRRSRPRPAASRAAAVVRPATRTMKAAPRRTKGTTARVQVKLSTSDGFRRTGPPRYLPAARVRALRRLLPLPAHAVDPGSLDSLYREAADYIACLQLQVKTMQAMVDALSSPSD